MSYLIPNRYINIKCERCQAEEVAIICHTCQPYHNFCHRCDSIIHSMKLKTNHVRETIYNTMLPRERASTNSPNVQIFPSGMPIQRSLTPEKDCIHSSFIENNKYNINTYIPRRNDQNYSNNFINEMKKLNEKEKDALKYKLASQQSHLEKLKEDFQKELKNSEDKANQFLKEKNILEQKLNQLIEVTLKEKNIKIDLLTKENEHLKEKAKILEEQLKEKNYECKKKEKEYNNYIDNLKEEIASIRDDNTNMQKCHMNKVSELVRNNDNNLKNINEIHQKEIYDIYYDGKSKNDKLIQQVENDYNMIEMLKKNSSNLQMLIQKLENNNNILLQENKELKNKNAALSNNLRSSYNVNESLKKNMEIIKTENNNMKNDFDYFENTICSLKNEIILMNESYIKKDNDFNYLLSQSEKIRKEFSENMFNNEELDLKNRELTKENEDLKRALSSFQGTMNC